MIEKMLRGCAAFFLYQRLTEIETHSSVFVKKKKKEKEETKNLRSEGLRSATRRSSRADARASRHWWKEEVT